jgi:hypothetical protein
MNEDTDAPKGSASHEGDLENGTSLVGWLYKQIDPPFESEQEFTAYWSIQVNRQSDLAKRARTLGISDDFNTYLKVCSEAGYDIDELGLCDAAEVALGQREKILSDRVAEQMRDVHAHKPNRLTKKKGEKQNEYMLRIIVEIGREKTLEWTSEEFAEYMGIKSQNVRRLPAWKTLQKARSDRQAEWEQKLMDDGKNWQS